ncbi:MAG TPA: tetratricopeptide repeat protein [Candidatus Angelobacter sp.]|nr:tetratricopeptide repeat protein [Candidatus Angelobacter sp.]
MLPRALMLTTKKASGNDGEKEGKVIFERRACRIYVSFVCPLICLFLGVLMTGCKPPGPRALLAGKQLLERGKYTEAVARLQKATTILSTNAQAWNYLGLAYHQAGNANDAAEAYKKALGLDQNLVEAYYNLGCLLLEQNHPDQAKVEFTAYTLHREKSPEGWVKLGEAQLALRDLVGAERSFNQARQIDAQEPEALNDMGVLEMERNRTVEAAQFFNAALRAKPGYAPALLNLAIVSERLGNRQYALQRYQEYLALKPRPASWDEVNAIVRALTQGNAPQAEAPRPAPASSAPEPAPARPAAAPAPRPARTERAAQSNPKPNPSSPAPRTEVVQVAPEPVIHGAAESGGRNASEPVVTSNTTAQHRGFFSHVNPANLFRSSEKPSASSAHSSTETAPAAQQVEPALTFARYNYRSPRKPADGDRTAAQRSVYDGAQAQQARQFSTAVADYKKATQLDPGYYDAYYDLGVASFQIGNVPEALSAYEMALAIQPDSHDARFNFALALKQANYPVDAAKELEKVLARSPNDVNAHFALGALYAQPLREPIKAREQYEKVLSLNPNFPQAAAIRDWLWANPK